MLEIYDCTLREGEQAYGASFNPESRIELCRKLDEFGVDYIELGWPMTSKEIFGSFEEALKIAKKAKIVAFGSTSIKPLVEDDENLNSIVKTGVKHACIFGKTSLSHVEKQLKINGEENLKKIFDSVKFLREKGVIVFYDAEHYFDAFKENKEYALQTLISAINGGVETLILCDTNGGVLPDESQRIANETWNVLKSSGFQAKLGVHFHEDCGLALANTLACLPYISQVQGTINGIGERVGNLNFSEFLPVYANKLGNKLNIDLKKLKKINEDAFRLSGINIPEKRAFVGNLAFSHKAGVHIDAHAKGASYEHENPEDFGNKRAIIMNTLGGKNSIVNIAEKFGYKLDKNNEETKEKIKELFEELKTYENEGYKFGVYDAEKFLLIEKYFGLNDLIFKINEWRIKSEVVNRNEISYFKVECRLNNKIIEGEMKVEGGPVDAAFKALKKMLSREYPEIENLKLIDFHVEIARRRAEESSVRTMITFSNTENFDEKFSDVFDTRGVSSDEEEFSVVGADKNILESAIEALEKGFRYYLIKLKKTKESDWNGNELG
jgi:2-isopropylmalate synthase